jgi:two-component system NtrC family sensor kinase
MWDAIRDRVRTTLRHKLFALVLFPTVLAMFATLGFTVFWFTDFTRDNLLLKVKTDLALGQHALLQIQQEYLGKLQRLADSYRFRALLASGDTIGLQAALQSLVKEEGFSFVHVTGELGNWLYEPRRGTFGGTKPSPLTNRAMRGAAGAAIELFTKEDLVREDATLPNQARIPLQAPAAVTDNERAFEERAMVLRLTLPIADAQGKTLAVLDAGILLNRNREFVNAVRDRVYSAGTLPEGGIGAVALLIDDVRVASNIPATSVAQDLGTRVSEDMRATVLGQRQAMVTRGRIGADWYILGYAPLYDVHGQGVAMLQTGFLETPFRLAYYWKVATLFFIFLGIILFSALVAFRGARAIFEPIEKMTSVVRATHPGSFDRRIGEIDSHDEIGELARQFDTMLDLVEQHNREIQRAADELEAKVEERTRELESKNADLESTVSLLRKTREQLVMAEKLAALGQFAAGIAHEINNPTAVILGNVDILVAELGSAAGSVQGEVDLIIQQVERIRHIVNTLLQLARPSTSIGELHRVDVNSVVRDTLPLVRHLIRGDGVVIRQRLEATRTVRINSFELQQVLINLMSNALRAVSRSGSIELTTEDLDTHGVLISVSDDGAGIAPGSINRVFDPFYTTHPQQSTGLGLSVSYGIMRRYGGDITVESDPGQGSVFRVWLLVEPVLEKPEDALPHVSGA